MESIHLSNDFSRQLTRKKPKLFSTLKQNTPNDNESLGKIETRKKLQNHKRK